MKEKRKSIHDRPKKNKLGINSYSFYCKIRSYKGLTGRADDKAVANML